MILLSTTDGAGYNPFLLSLRKPGSAVNLIRVDTSLKRQAAVNILVATAITVISFLSLTSIIRASMAIALLVLCTWIAAFSGYLVSRLRGGRLMRSHVVSQEFRVSIFTVEWVMLALAGFAVSSSLRQFSVSTSADTGLLIASGVLAAFMLIPFAQASLMNLQSTPKNSD